MIDRGIRNSARFRRAMVGVVFLLVTGVATGKVASTTLVNLFTISDRVVVGKVMKIEKRGGYRWARVAVWRNVKGKGAQELLFLAEPTWTCDISDAKAGEEALLFLVDAAKPDSWLFHSPNQKKLPPKAYVLAWSGRGQMPVRKVKGEDYVTAWSDVEIPATVPRIPGPEPEYSFIQSFRLANLLEHLAPGNGSRPGKP